VNQEKDTMHSKTSIRTRGAIAAAMTLVVTSVALAFSASPARAQACCNTVSCKTTVPPDAPFSGPLFFNLQSSCTGRVCGGSITLATNTTTQSKCSQLVSAINTTCAGAGFQVLASGNQCANLSQFIVTDTLCNCTPGLAGKGISLFLSNSGATGSFLQSGFLPDYENDTITTCATGSTAPGAGGSLGSMSGTGTGTPIVGNQASVSFDVFTEKGQHVIETVNTTMGMTPSQVVAAGVSACNQGLAGAASTGRCSADSSNPTNMRCSLSGSGALETDLPLAFQLNDTGFVRFMGSGPSADVDAAQRKIDSQGGIPDVTKFTVVTPPLPAPAAPPWAFAGLAALLAAGGAFLLRSRGASPRSAEG
jgi:hypothetical protein